MPYSDACPYLVPVTADHLWLYPVSSYCTSRDRTRVPGAMSIAQVCMEQAHTQCAGYLAARRQRARSCITDCLELDACT